MSNFRCLNDTPCVYCKYLKRIDTGFIYCKKYMGGNRLLTRLSYLTICGNFKPKKGLKFVYFNNNYAGEK